MTTQPAIQITVSQHSSPNDKFRNRQKMKDMMTEIRSKG